MLGTLENITLTLLASSIKIGYAEKVNRTRVKSLETITGQTVSRTKKQLTLLVCLNDRFRLVSFELHRLPCPPVFVHEEFSRFLAIHYLFNRDEIRMIKE